jgi:hypothetical protein
MQHLSIKTNIAMVNNGCHQTWLDNPRTKWELNGKIIEPFMVDFPASHV